MPIRRTDGDGLFGVSVFFTKECCSDGPNRDRVQIVTRNSDRTVISLTKKDAAFVFDALQKNQEFFAEEPKHEEKE